MQKPGKFCRICFSTSNGSQRRKNKSENNSHGKSDKDLKKESTNCLDGSVNKSVSKETFNVGFCLVRASFFLLFLRRLSGWVHFLHVVHIVKNVVPIHCDTKCSIIGGLFRHPN